MSSSHSLVERASSRTQSLVSHYSQASAFLFYAEVSDSCSVCNFPSIFCIIQKSVRYWIPRLCFFGGFSLTLFIAFWNGTYLKLGLLKVNHFHFYCYFLLFKSRYVAAIILTSESRRRALLFRNSSYGNLIWLGLVISDTLD